MNKKEKMNYSSPIQEFIDNIMSGTSLLYIHTTDEVSTLVELRQAISSINLHGKNVGNGREFGYYEWSSTSGVVMGTIEKLKHTEDHYRNLIDKSTVEKNGVVMAPTSVKEDTKDPVRAMNYFGTKDPVNDQHDYDGQVVVFKDLHPHLKNAGLVRRIKDIAITNNDDDCTVRRFIVILSPVKNIPVEFQNLINVINWKLPNKNDIGTYLKETVVGEVVDDKTKIKKVNGEIREKYNDTEFSEMVNALTGLTMPEIDNVVSVSRVRFDEIVPSFLLEQKRQLIMRNGLLEYHSPEVGMDEIGGMDCLKDWIRKRKNAFGPEAEKFGIEAPKGILLVGIQGCGKSAMAKAIANELGVPQLVLDIGKLFNKTVGSSEENAREVIALVESVGHCVLSIDEIEKGLGGIQSSNQSDGGTTSRVVGTLLQWMQEKDCPALIVATANNVKDLPPELQRKGRIDEIFFAPLPEEIERKDIFKIHLRKRGRDPEKFDIDLFSSEVSDNFSGAEVEEVIKSALILAFDEGSELEDKHIMQAIHEMIPLYKTCEEDLNWLYDWVGWNAEKEDGVRARYASTARKKVSKEEGKNILRIPEKKKKGKK